MSSIKSSLIYVYRKVKNEPNILEIRLSPVGIKIGLLYKSSIVQVNLCGVEWSFVNHFTCTYLIF